VRGLDAEESRLEMCFSWAGARWFGYSDRFSVGRKRISRSVIVAEECGLGRGKGGGTENQNPTLNKETEKEPKLCRPCKSLCINLFGIIPCGEGKFVVFIWQKPGTI